MELLEVKKYVTDIKLDLRYATKNNVTSRILYKNANAYLVKDACLALCNVQSYLQKQGYGLIIWDAYRPYTVTKQLWDAAPAHNKSLTFADPMGGSIHNKGCAVDVTLYDLKTGKELTMQSGFDDMTNMARPNYKKAAKEHKDRTEQLRMAFETHGFARDEYEWWHFNWKEHAKYKILDIPL